MRNVSDSRSAFSVRNCPAFRVLASTWQSHVALQVVKSTCYTYPEKAGVGGSTPSLATIIPKNLAEIRRQETGKITHGRSPTPTG